MPDKRYTVYKHTSPSGKVYIGITSQRPEYRWQNGKGYKDSPAFKQAIDKYGWDNIEHEILKSGLTKEEAEAEEIRLIKEYKSTDKHYGYNIEHGGNCAGTHSEETRKKISKANKGRTFSEESIQKMREAHKGQGVGEKNPFYGRHHSEETKKKHSEFMRGNDYNKGKHHTDEFKVWKSKQMTEKFKNGEHPKCKAVEHIDGDHVTKYYSMREAARQIGESPSAVYKWVHDETNQKWRFADEQTA